MKIVRERLFLEFCFGVMRTREADRKDKVTVTLEEPFRLRVAKITLAKFDSLEDQTGFVNRLMALPYVNPRQPAGLLQKELLEKLVI